MIYIIIGIILFIILLFMYCSLKIAHDADEVIEIISKKD